MSAPVVFIGFILLIPTALGLLFSFFLFMETVNTAGNNDANKALANKRVRTEAIEEMRRASVPEDIINTAVKSVDDAGNTVDQEHDLAEITAWGSSDPRPTQFQRDAVINAVKTLDALATKEKAATRVDNAMTGGLGLVAICIGIGSIVVGLLGWLLVMKKRVLQCGTCGAVVNAS
jgi:hypothetical protein